MSRNLVESFRKPVPSVVNTAPALTTVLKKSAGKLLLLSKGLAAAPSQLISRRPVGCSPATAPFGAPIWFLNAVNVSALLLVATNSVHPKVGDLDYGDVLQCQGST